MHASEASVSGPEKSWDRIKRFQEKTLEEATGIKGWQSEFTSVTVKDRNETLFNDTRELYAPMLTFLQKSFEPLHISAEKGFDYHYRAFGKYPRQKAPKKSEQAGQRQDFFSVYEQVKEVEKTDEELEKELAEIKAKEKKEGVSDYTKFIPDVGVWKTQWQGETVYALNAGFVADSSTISFYVKGRNRREFLQDMMDNVMRIERPPPVRKAPPKVPDNFAIYKYNVKRGWLSSGRGISRSLESVVLPKETRDAFMEDLDDFLRPEHKQWFIERNIPYKRCYLFYGVPGSGKTSLLSVIAGMYKMCICYLTPTSDEMDDDSLRNAIQRLPKKAVLVIEDVDALFTKDREGKVTNGLTFSGMLNALDGVGMALGQVIVLSTNFRDRLDPALIRNGRVDKHIRFNYIQPPEIRKMFRVFYKDASLQEQSEFADAIARGKGDQEISAATLQQVFISCFKLKKEETLKVAEEKIREIVMSTQMDEESEESRRKELQLKKEKEKEKAKGKGSEGQTKA